MKNSLKKQFLEDFEVILLVQLGKFLVKFNLILKYIKKSHFIEILI